MSLSLIPAPFADRLTTGVRAAQNAASSAQGKGPDPDAGSDGFAKLLDAEPQPETPAAATFAQPVATLPVATMPVPATTDPALAIVASPISGPILPAPSADGTTTMTDQSATPDLTDARMDPANPAVLASDDSAEGQALNPNPKAGDPGKTAAVQEFDAGVTLVNPKAVRTTLLTGLLPEPDVASAQNHLPPVGPASTDRSDLAGNGTLEKPDTIEAVPPDVGAKADPAYYAGQIGAMVEPGHWTLPAPSISQSAGPQLTRASAQPGGENATPAPMLRPSADRAGAVAVTLSAQKPVLQTGLAILSAATDAQLPPPSQQGTQPSLTASQTYNPEPAAPPDVIMPLGGDALTGASTATRTGPSQLFAAYAAMAKPDQQSVPAWADATLAPAMAPWVGAGDPGQIASSAGPKPQIAGGSGTVRSGSGPTAADDVATPLPPGGTVTGSAHRSPAPAPSESPAAKSLSAIWSTDSAGSTPALAEIPRQNPGMRTAELTHVSPQSSRATAAHIASQLAQAVGQTVGGSTDITLNPKELGHVKLTLQAVDGTIFVAITAERPETAELMRRHIDSLAQEFRGLGYQDVSFSFAGRHGGNGPGPHPGYRQGPDSQPVPQSDTDLNTPADRYIPRRAAAQTGNTGLDLRL